ncbi:MAG: tRNA 2-thiouridine(34) synthase MnmA [Phycisphaerae bacterium]
MRGEKILVAMSGGVDSSVAAHLLKEQGYEPVGVFMRSGVALPDGAAGAPRCCSAEDASDARRVAGQLGIAFYVLNFAEDFGRLIDRFCEEYGRGRTPNPCILCNRDMKFGRLFRYADALGAKCVATGHYARVEWEAGQWRLKRGLDAEKDQSYVLFPIRPERLERVRLPLGERTKQETRTIARELGLAVRDKPESQEICFVTGTIEALVRQRRPDLVRPGPVLDLGGKELGRHAGIVNFTIGQRRGLGIALGEPRYVVAIRPEDAAIVIGPASALRAKGLVAEEVVWHEPVPAEPVRAEVQIRYRHAAAGAWLERLEEDRAQVRFDEPQAAVTPGQAAVFYRGERVAGGGWIEQAINAECGMRNAE